MNKNLLLTLVLCYSLYPFSYFEIKMFSSLRKLPSLVFQRSVGQQLASPSSTFSHITSDGNIAMVDIGAKPSTQRHAIAEAVVKFPDSRTYQSYFDVTTKKGDARLCSKIAGILAAKVREQSSFPTPPTRF